ncbi:MAG: VIT1/CCC1 transporter family protein, partial [Acetobacteraceae bacterium]|nr:VIT1/CCC1 transporter family protein [Acetobacteraceae bacterium]
MTLRTQRHAAHPTFGRGFHPCPARTLPSKKSTRHAPERHRVEHLGWLRAAVLGANGGLVSTASLAVGVAAADPSPQAVLLAGVAGLTAGALSMAAGEFVSVSSQADTESADVVREGAELAAVPEQELAEFAAICRARGLIPTRSKADPCGAPDGAPRPRTRPA